MAKAMDLKRWRQAQLVPDGRGGTRSMTQKELAAKVGVGHSLISRIEGGERWPSERVWEGVYNLVAPTMDLWRRIGRCQLRTWRAYDPSRKGKRP